MKQLAKKPDILFMGRIFSDAKWGGVREMATELLTSLGPICEEQNRKIEVLVPQKNTCPVTHPAIREVHLPRFSSNIFLWDHLTVSQYANSRKKSVVLYNIKLVLPLGLKVAGFTTIHDLMYFAQPNKYDWREYLLPDTIYMRLMVPRSLRLAPMTHIVSDYTGKDAKDLFPKISSRKFITIHHGIRKERWSPEVSQEGDEERLADLRKRGATGNYILYSGGLSRRKNPSVLLKSFLEFHKENPDWRLVVTGGTKPTRNDPGLQELMDSMPGDSFIRLGFVDDRSLTLLYHHAAFSVFPSLYEGFGLPALEAQAAHCPLICSDRTSLPEVVGDSALLFNPESVDELTKAMVLLASNERKREELIEAGKSNIRKFTWEKTARRFLKLADAVFSSKKPS